MTESTAEQQDRRCGLPRYLSCAAAICLPCLAVATLAVILLLTIIFVQLQLPVGLSDRSLSGYLVLFYTYFFVPIVGFVADIVRALSPWGIIFFAIVLFLAWGPDWVRETISASRLEFPGGFKFSGGGFRGAFRKELGDAARLVDRFNKELRDAYDAAIAFTSELRDELEITDIVSRIAKQVAEVIGSGCPTDFRLTVYIQDPLFSDRLYQLCEYYDRFGNRISNGKTGRTLSIRYGIIGRVWRSGIDEIEGELVSDEERGSQRDASTSEDLERLIARRWGLTLEDAAHVKQYNSYAAIRLKRADAILGILYFDSKARNAFGHRERMDEVLNEVKRVLDEARLLPQLARLVREIAPLSGRMEVYKNAR